MPSQWFIRRGSKTLGPYNSEQLKHDAAAGLIIPTDEICKSLSGPWVAARKVKGLFAVQLVDESTKSTSVSHKQSTESLQQNCSVPINDTTLDRNIQSHVDKRDSLSIPKCQNCGTNISKRAKTCPNCGEPAVVKKKTGCITVVVAIILLIMILQVVIATFQNNSPSATSKIDKETWDTEINKQPERKAMIDKLIGMGVFTKVDGTLDRPNLWVAPMFYNLDYDKKVTFSRTVYDYYIIENRGLVRLSIIDSKSGKEIGSFEANTLNMN